MNKTLTVSAVVICVAAIAIATPQSHLNSGLAPNAMPGRFTIDREAWEVPILLDTATGEMWMLQESTNLVEARMVAWTPMRRISNDAELHEWAEEGRALQDRYLATLKAQSLADLEQKMNALGPDHPEVVNAAKEIERFPLFQGVTDADVEAIKNESRAGEVKLP